MFHLHDLVAHVEGLQVAVVVDKENFEEGLRVAMVVDKDNFEELYGGWSFIYFSSSWVS